MGLSNISVGELLKEKFPDQVKNKLLCNDKDVIEVVKEQLALADESKGVLLDGFPRTKVQARALQQMKIIPDKILILSGDSDYVRNKLRMKVPESVTDEDVIADTVEARLQQYLRHIKSTMETFKNSVVEIDVGGGDSKTIVDQVQNIMHRVCGGISTGNTFDVSDLDPRGPLRVCVIGPLGSGRTTQSRLVAHSFGVVHVDVNAMISSSERQTPVESLTDEELCSLVGSRLRQADCLRKGWVLDGFPNTPSQAEFLKKAHLWPSRVVHLSISESVCLQRLSVRRIDPVTGAYYYGIPFQLAIRQRIVQPACDTPEQVSERYHFHYERQKDILATFKKIHTILRANQDPTVLQRAIQDFIKLSIKS